MPCWQKLNVSLIILGSLGISLIANANPLDDLNAFRGHYQKIFPSLSLNDYADGLYAIDPISRASWVEIEKFPPYEFAIDAGKKLFETPFKNGKFYRDCFNNKGIAVAQNYPKWDAINHKVITLASAINECRIKYHQQPLAYEKGEISQLLAYMASTSRGLKINISISMTDSKALAAYEQGKRYFYQRRGQLNFSCAVCHIDNVGKRIRADILSPALGHTSHWPSYRFKWGEMGTLHRRFIGCHQQIRAKLPKAQSEKLRNLEYFLTFMGNGIPLNAPSTRR
ncbi:MAG: sulfur oxidation c-type cytochrome SoxA [Methylococcales bacterium]|nr:sulfur oxidation c-type cytochrome SoxA [Methylococcales bacterium]